MCVQSIVVRLISEMVPAVSTVGSCLELTTDVKVVKVSEQLSHHEIVLTTSESGDNARECQHCGFEFLRVFNQQRHACPLEPDLDLSIPVLTLLSGEEAEQFRADHRCNTADQVNIRI